MTLGTNFLSYNFYAQHEDDDDAQLPYFAEKLLSTQHMYTNLTDTNLM